MKRLENKIALVTGGSRGMGAAIVKRLAQEGATVAFTYVRGADKAAAVVAKLEKDGHRTLAILADAADPAAVISAVDKTIAAFGRIDILVNNAGIAFMKPFEEYTLEDYDLTMDVNVKAVFVASQAVARQLGNGGRIITIGSCMADRVVGPYGTLYSMSKSALTAFNKGLARDLGPRGITVNLVQPGPVDTDMNPADGPHADDQRRHVSLGHYGHVNDIAAAVAFLASPEAGYIHGTALTVDGGLNS
ncbi:3-oxoacyl-ACP reductase family protein [Chitinophaga nivalis]|uniref:3-oxoacyl-ACP reductase FabG n=1 Tax=Chitinophaga nivalis TaxID=2991709 RepID=A0ABT3ITG7_9BACT|nr:3-oxoacyl-ACP reductase family protein [Chitinophaga nivalis]MCW3463066.1 3-oxoacyl-ACP reductase FabG [Chitinophaga nivalis]MCW3487244.1 3-oxoacyl-ACP reductase FabG [Chitinophaga nivalis]